MGTPGVPTTITKDQIAEAIKKKKGVGAHICKMLDISYPTFYDLIAKYDLKEELQKERNAFGDVMCDQAENILMRAINQDQDMPSALGAAKYILNNKGRDRGYYPPVPPPENKDTAINEFHAGIKQVAKQSGGKAVRGRKVEAKQPLQDS